MLGTKQVAAPGDVTGRSVQNTVLMLVFKLVVSFPENGMHTVVLEILLVFNYVSCMLLQLSAKCTVFGNAAVKRCGEFQEATI